VVVINRPALSALVLADFQQQALLQHNYLRQLHCAGSIALNSSLNTIAQNYANYLAANNLFRRSETTGLGENLWSMSSSGIIGAVNGRIYIIFFKIYQIYISVYLLGSTPINN
jgi:uncharacterized protein YkwD